MCNARTKDNSGYSLGFLPLSIPNREVKPYSADVTAFVGEYVAAFALLYKFNIYKI